MLSKINTIPSTEPFRDLILNTNIDISSLVAKTEAINLAVRRIEYLETQTENTSIRNHWMSIFSGFGTAATIATVGSLNPQEC